MPTQERRAAVDRWYRMHAGAMYRYAVRRVEVDGADDVVAQVFHAALTTAVAPKSDHEALPWLYGIARNIVASSRRQQMRQVLLRDRLREVPPPTQGDIAELVVSHEWVTSIFAQLSRDDAELLRLIVWERLNTAAAATVLGIRAGTARVRLHRLRRRIEQQLPSAMWEQLTREAATS